MKKSLKKQKKFIIFILLSLLLHIAFFRVNLPTFAPPPKAPMIVERITLPPEQEKKQVVSQPAPSQDVTPPKDSQYLSKENQTVKEETKAIQVAKPKNSTPSTPKKKTLTMADLGLKPIPQPSRKPSHYRPPSSTDDYLPNIKEGPETALNTREFKFYSYFERIKDRLRMYWEPELTQRVQRIYAQGKDIGDQDLITKLTIVLNKKGELSKIKIIRNSGVEDVDSAAVKAFELAAPFPNPPSGMVDQDGNVYLTWSFIVQTQGLSNIFVFLSRR